MSSPTDQTRSEARDTDPVSRRRRRRAWIGAGLMLIAVFSLCDAVLAPAAHAAESAQSRLAERYSPVVRLVEQTTPCGGGEPFVPLDVKAVLGNDQVALRGPWQGSNVVKVAPTGADLSAGLANYHLDFPGDALRAGCSYEDWQKQLDRTTVPTTYARVVSQSGQTALAYWFFYIYNDFNNKHEGDWEMIQLDFPARSAAAALDVSPNEVGYSQHDGAEEASWDAAKLEKEGGTHPVVYPAEGSHANYFEPALYLGASATAGVGCDNTRGPWREVKPAVALVPTDAAAIGNTYPWLEYLGHWGEEHPSFYDGPTGPNVHQQWDQPITWAQTRWHPSSMAIPGGVDAVPRATDLFCNGVSDGSALLTFAVNGGPTVVAAVLGVILLGILAAVRMAWRPSHPFALARRRSLGQIITASFRLHRTNPRLYLAIGAVFLPVSLAIAGIQALLFNYTRIGALEQEAGPTSATIEIIALALGLALTPIALTVVQAMVAASVAHAEQERELLPRTALAVLRSHIRPLMAALVVVVAAIAALSLTIVAVPVAVWLLVRWSLFSQSIVLEDLHWRSGLHRSSQLVRGHWWHVAVITIVIVGVALLLGPAIGVVLLLFTPLNLVVINIASGVVYVLTVPYAAIATTYLYYDLRVRETTRQDAPVLPAEAVLE